ncbi:prolyl oligopeptidase family serine peptidase [Iamia sp.]|uniref:prolyl oligopeptidase family serine peptidase n=1 Tax=Iamia sp. TaxID=2722710 RepID=UPI002C9581A2|nr:prolyl oligopeptidase family serine peptidase [Iamia sp.]HXH56532.1 prolyl oligopeptidase family serine peptidase [Iamia sp.]
MADAASLPPVPAAPPARAEPLVEVIHGHRVPDPHRWLEDGDDPAVQRWDDAQSERARTVLDAVAGRGALRRRLGELLDVPVVLGAAVAGDHLFAIERGDGRDQAVLTVASALGDAPGSGRVLIDPAALLDDPTAALDWYHPSPDGALVAVGLSTGGDELSTLRVVETGTGALLPDAIPRTRAASVAWRSDGSGFAYTRYPDPATVPEGEAGYHRIVLDHDIGAEPAGDAPVWDALPDPTAWPDVRVSRDDRWLLVHVSVGWDRTDVHLCDRTDGTWRTVIEGIDALTDLHVVGDRLVGTTTLDAPTGRVVAAPLADPWPAAWIDLVPASDAVIEAIVPTSESLLVVSTRDAVAHLARIPRPDRAAATDAGLDSAPAPIALPSDGSLFALSGSRERDEAFVGFTSFAQPPTLLRWSDGDLEPWTASGPDRTHDGSAFAVERHRYPSTDGTEVTLFTLRRADVDPERSTPTILTGYGGFGVTMSPGYSAEAVAHAERGGVWAVACIRGGSELGEAWHRAGQRAHKPQVFADFEAAADWLVAEGRTGADHLAIRGGSNGGLLVTAVLTRRPDLCAAVHAAVPLCDMVRFPRFRIARLWVPEYGDPGDPADLAWLLSYSPYHRVVDGTRYPAVLLTTGAEDSRVDPLHARKMAARLQGAADGVADPAPVLLRVERGAGHGQGKPTSRRAEEGADVLGFLHAVIGVSPAPD